MFFTWTFTGCKYAVFFSPSGVKALLPRLDPATVTLLAMGSTTANAIQALGWQVGAVAKSPDANSLLAALNTLP